MGVEGLSRRERQVFTLFLAGHRWKEIAGQLNIGERTVNTYHAALLRKLGVNNTVDLVKIGIRHGLTTLEPDFRTRQDAPSDAVAV